LSVPGRLWALAWLMLVEGVLELFAMLALFVSLPTVARAARSDGVADLDFLVKRALLLGVLLLLGGILKVLTALRTFDGRGEKLRTAAVLSSVAGVLTGCLAPTGLALLGFGLYQRFSRRTATD
jgi:uncharacterized membrane protein HdeD (DUF308 family)